MNYCFKQKASLIFLNIKTVSKIFDKKSILAIVPFKLKCLANKIAF